MTRLDRWPPPDNQANRWGLDPDIFAREALGFTPDAHQARVLTSDCARGLLNCTRQWGKSTVIALKAVHQGLFVPESMILVVSPSERQSREFLRKAKRSSRASGSPSGETATIRSRSNSRTAPGSSVFRAKRKRCAASRRSACS
jgi:hypothetical protein